MNIRVKALFIIAAAVYLSSCKKNDDAPQVNISTSVNVINASNNNINFYQNGIRLNNAGTYLPGGTLGYVPMLAGEPNFQVKIAGPANANNVLFALSLKLDSTKIYSLYITGQTAESVFYAPDTLKAATADSAKIRFVNASANAGALGLSFTGMDKNMVILDTPKFKNVNYKTTTQFITVKSGVRNLGIYRSSSLLSRDTVTLNAGGVYTVFSYGAVTPVGEGLSTGFITNQ